METEKKNSIGEKKTKKGWVFLYLGVLGGRLKTTNLAVLTDGCSLKTSIFPNSLVVWVTDCILVPDLKINNLV